MIGGYDHINPVAGAIPSGGLPYSCIFSKREIISDLLSGFFSSTYKIFNTISYCPLNLSRSFSGIFPSSFLKYYSQFDFVYCNGSISKFLSINSFSKFEAASSILFSSKFLNILANFSPNSLPYSPSPPISSVSPFSRLPKAFPRPSIEGSSVLLPVSEKPACISFMNLSYYYLILAEISGSSYSSFSLSSLVRLRGVSLNPSSILAKSSFSSGCFSFYSYFFCIDVIYINNNYIQTKKIRNFIFDRFPYLSHQFISLFAFCLQHLLPIFQSNKLLFNFSVCFLLLSFKPFLFISFQKKILRQIRKQQIDWCRMYRSYKNNIL